MGKRAKSSFDIFNEQKNMNDINKYIILIMKIIVIFLGEKHPSIINLKR